MTVVETLCGIVAALTGTGFLVVSVRTASTIRRALRHRVSRVVALTNGPAKIAGTLSAREPLIGLDGTRAVARRREIVCRGKSNGDWESRQATFQTACAEIEISDDSGACALEMGSAFIVGPSRSYRLSRHVFEERAPELWAELAKINDGLEVVDVSVDETLVPDGSTGVVCGRASLDEAGIHQGGGYRRGNRRVKWTGDDEHPLILSAWGEKPLLRHVGGPFLGVAWIGILLWLLAVATAALPLLLARAAAL